MRKRLAAILAFLGLYTFALSGCSFSFVSTEDEMYSALQEAGKELLTKPETFTCEISITSDINDGITTATTKSDITYSIQPKNNKMFITMLTSLASGSETLETEVNVKVGEVDSGYYLYAEKPISQTLSEINCYSISKEEAKSLMSFSTLLEYTDLDIEELFEENDYSYTELKNSYESVFTEQLAERKKMDGKAQAQTDVSIEKKSGEIALRQKMLVETVDTSGRNIVCMETEEETVGKKDKITKAYLKNNILLKSNNREERISKYEKTEVCINFSYNFDEEGYKAIDTDGKSFTSGFGEMVGMASFTLHLDELLSEQYVEASLLSNDLNFSKITKSFRGEGYKVEWFTDKKCQNLFKPNELSRKEFKDTENLYGKLAIEDGYAVCAIDYEINDARDEAYKIVFGQKIPHYNGEEKIYSTKLTENTIYTFLPYDEYIDEIYVNGIKQLSEEIILENKQAYYVKYVENIDNSTESIFDISTYFG